MQLGPGAGDLAKNLLLAPWAGLGCELGSGPMLTAHQGTGRSGWFEAFAIGVVLVALLIGCGKDEGKIVEHWDGKTQLIHHASLPKARPASKTDFKAVPLGGAKLNLTVPVNWKQQPQGRLHQWEWMWPLLRAYQDTKDKESLRRSIEIALDWVKENPLTATKKQRGRAWLASAVAWRARALGYLIRAGAEAKVLSGDEFERLMLAAREHASWLSNDENYKMGSSHSLYQDHGLATLCKQLNKLPDCQAWGAIARQRFLENLALIVDQKTGVHKEHSPRYHGSTAGLVERMASLTGDKTLKEWAERMYDVSGWFVMPDKRFALLGETIYSKPPKRSVSASAGKKGFAPLDRVGYGIVKQEGSYLAAVAAFHGERRKHLDELSFSWFDAGSRIIADSGYFTRRKGSQHQYAESSAAHNVLLVDDKELKLRGRPYGSAITALGEHEGWYALMGTNPLIRQKGVRQTRLWLYRPGEWLFVIDRVRSGGEHEYTRLFHFWPKLEVALSEDGVASAKLPKAPLEVRDISGGDLKASAKLIENRKKPLQGVAFLNGRKATPNQVLELTTRAKDALLGVAFRLGEIPEKPEKFALSWDEEQGYQLKFGKQSLGVRRHQNELVVAVDGKVPDSAAAKALEGKPEADEEPDDPGAQKARPAPAGSGAPGASGVPAPGAKPPPTGAKPAPAGAKPAPGSAKPPAPPKPAPAQPPAAPAQTP